MYAFLNEDFTNDNCNGLMYQITSHQHSIFFIREIEPCETLR